MSLSDRLASSEHRPKKSLQCSACKWYDALPEQDRREFDAWVDADLSIVDLHRACRAEGLPVKLTQFKHHLRQCHAAQ